MQSWLASTYLARWLPVSFPPQSSHRSSSPRDTDAHDDLISNTANSARRPPLPSSPCPANSLAEVLSVAEIHPFYSDVQYPPDEDALHAARERAASSLAQADISTRPLLQKEDLYTVIKRLVKDTSPQNTYRQNVYTSVTGGGGNTSTPLFFATDALENRRHRAYFGQLLRDLGVIRRGDWVLTTHFTGDLYRSLDLTCEIMENAGASILAAGNHMAPSKVVKLLRDFSVNVLTGDGSQVVSIVHHISTLSSSERDGIRIDKVIYTSEGLTAAQRAHIRAVLGPVKIYSILGSAEAGPYGVGIADPTSSDTITSDQADFLIDTRMTLIEILPFSFAEGDFVPETLPEGETGVIAQTSLTRLRNPLVRYLTGDVGSLHPLPEETPVPEASRRYMRLLRLRGRDRRFSFLWDGYDFDIEKLSAFMVEPGLGILQWQVHLYKMEPSMETALNMRVLTSLRDDENMRAVVDGLKQYFLVYELNQHKFQVTFVKDLSGFELSQTGRKVIKFVGRCN